MSGTYLLELLLSLLDILKLVLLLMGMDPLVRQIVLQRLPLVLLLERAIDRESLMSKLHPLVLESEDLFKPNQIRASQRASSFSATRTKTRLDSTKEEKRELTLSESFSIDPACPFPTAL